jgi:pimeloyl-ACP methyl ester carboxylesterase
MRISTRIALITIAILLIAAVSGAAFNYFAVRHYRKTYPVPGQMYSVDGRKMHLYCMGTGSPTLVLEAGRGDDFLVWARVQSELARVTRDCSYDRSGLGWSEYRTGQRDANTIPNQLHELLLQAAISDRLILVGHSLGGLIIRSYAARFPEQAVGLVLVDSSTPDQAVQLPKSDVSSELQSTSMPSFDASASSTSENIFEASFSYVLPQLESKTYLTSTRSDAILRRRIADAS